MTTKKVQTLALALMAMTPRFAQGGATAISNAANDIRACWNPAKLILKALAGLSGVIGGLRVYNKWTNGDQDLNKEILGYGGAMIFLLVVPEFVTAFFNYKMGYYLYKGLKKPLVFFGLKGKYILYAVGIIGAGVVCALILSKFGLLGSLLGLVVTAGAVYVLFKRQDKYGLYNKTKNFNQLLIFPKRVTNKTLLKRVTNKK